MRQQSWPKLAPMQGLTFLDGAAAHAAPAPPLQSWLSAARSARRLPWGAAHGHRGGGRGGAGAAQCHRAPSAPTPPSSACVPGTRSGPVPTRGTPGARLTTALCLSTRRRRPARPSCTLGAHTPQLLLRLPPAALSTFEQQSPLQGTTAGCTHGQRQESVRRKAKRGGRGAQD